MISMIDDAVHENHECAQNKSKDEADEEYDVAGEDVHDALCVTKRFESRIPMTSRIRRGLVKFGRCLKLPECDLSHIGELTLHVLAPSESLFFHPRDSAAFSLNRLQSTPSTYCMIRTNVGVAGINLKCPGGDWCTLKCSLPQQHDIRRPLY